MTARQFDVVIVGGGPGGTSTGLSLLKNDPTLKIALLEKTSLEKKRVGEILKPAAQSLLEHLGIWQEFLEEQYSPAGSIRKIWGTENDLHQESLPLTEDQGWDIDRRAFDNLLFKLAGQKGVNTFANHELMECEKNANDCWHLKIQGPNENFFNLETPFLVDATGQSPFIAPKQGAHRVRFDRLVGVFVIFKNDGLAQDSSVMAETNPHGWWYSILLPDDLTLAAFMTDNDLVGDLELIKSKKWWDLLRQSQFTYPRVKSCVPISDFCMRIADSYLLDHLQGDGWVSVGDASARLDPLSGHGMCWAMQSGIYASDAIINRLKGISFDLTTYQKQMEKEYQNYLLERMQVYSFETRWAENPFWQRRHNTERMDPTLKLFLSKAQLNSEEIQTFNFFHGFQDKLTV
jgi:2-polyprenyl-6-methoxyphenol hydroxylase-like FAD-dependent oxidoreductase